jgi:exosortase C (VPDSG-CTERM-specific)
VPELEPAKIPDDLRDIVVGPPGNPRADLRRRMTTLAWMTAGLVLCFCRPLYDLVRFALRSDLYSHILLVPAIGLYLAWLKREELRAEFRPASRLAATLAGAGAVLLAGCGFALFSGWQPGDNDRLCALTLAFLFFLWAAAALMLGRNALRALAFPLAFLVFMAPLPSILQNGIESFLQHASADTAYVMIKMSGTPVYREGTVFMLPGITFEVAPECSGIHSSVVLFMTGLLAGHFFLQKARIKTALVLGVVVLGIIRNAARIYTLAELCVHVNPEIIHSGLHQHGGPLFFAVSLVPFFILIWLLRKLELRPKKFKP